MASGYAYAGLDFADQAQVVIEQADFIRAPAVEGQIVKILTNMAEYSAGDLRAELSAVYTAASKLARLLSEANPEQMNVDLARGEALSAIERLRAKYMSAPASSLASNLGLA